MLTVVVEQCQGIKLESGAIIKVKNILVTLQDILWQNVCKRNCDIIKYATYQKVTSFEAIT